MTRYTTLTDFVDLQVTKFNLADTEKMRKKLRRKFTRELEKIGIWEQAETKLIGRNQTKVFTDQQLETLYTQIEPYLLKQSNNIDTEALESYRNSLNKHINSIKNMTDEDWYEQIQEIENRNQFIPTVSKQEIDSLMLEALFLKFYEPINVKQWNNDLEIDTIIDNFDEEQAGRLEVFQARQRLQNPLQSYTNPRKDI